MNRQEAESGASARIRLAMLLAGCTDAALGRHTAEGLAATHRIAAKDCEYSLAIERQRRRRVASACLDDFPLENDADEPWFIEAKDKHAVPELRRQTLFLSRLHNQAPAVDAVAIPNANKGSDWERIRRWKEGARAGALDLVLTWQPTRADDRGVFFAEFKDGKSMPTREQRDRLNLHFRHGHGCGVFRQPDTLLAHLRAAGAPFL